MQARTYYDSIGKDNMCEPVKRRFDQTFPHLLEQGKILDVGCGCGHWLDYVSQRADLLPYGLDISPLRLAEARRNIAREACLTLGDVTQLPYKDKEFEQVTALEVVEHIPDWRKAVSDAIRVASKRVVITVPFKEDIKYVLCPSCGNETTMTGHLHSFREEDFEELLQNGNVRFRRLPQTMGIDHYFRKACHELFERTSAAEPEYSFHNFVCEHCYSLVENQRAFIARSLSRLEKMISRKPENLLVQIDK